MSMDAGHDDHDASADELAELAARHLAGELDVPGSQRLAALLASDAARRDEFVRLCYQAQLLQSRLRPFLASGDSPSQQIDGKPGLRAILTLSGRYCIRSLNELAKDFARQPLALAILVLVVVCGGVLYWQLSQMAPAPQQQASGDRKPAVDAAPSLAREEQGAGTVAPRWSAPSSPEASIARLTRSVDASWGPNEPLSDGAVLKAGQKLALASGMAEIAFDSGVTVIVEGPAEIEVGSRRSEVGRAHAETPTSDVRPPISANSCSLTLGKLVARVPRQAHGFSVATPTMKIVDLGTEFGVIVRSGTSLPAAPGLKPPATYTTEVQVFLGRVDVQPQRAQAPAPRPQPAEPIHLQAGEGVRGDASGQASHKIEADPSAFVRTLPKKSPLVPLAPWPKDSPLHPGDIVAVANGKTRFNLFKIDPRTGEQKLLATGMPYRQARIDYGLMWQSVAVEHDGNVLVGAKGLGAEDAGLLRIDPRNGQIHVVARGGILKAEGITGLAVAADGAIYAGYRTGGHGALDFVLKIDPASGQVTPLVRFGSSISGVCFDAGGRDLLVSSSKDATLGLVHLTPEPKVTTWHYDRSLASFDCVAVNRQGRVFVGTAQDKPGNGEALTRELRILEVSRLASQPVKTLAVTPQTGRGWSPISMACEADGNLIVGYGGEHLHIDRVDANTGKVTVLSTGGLIEPITLLTVVPGDPGAAAGEEHVR